MVRPKGGRRQPRKFELMDRAANQICEFLTNPYKKPVPSPIERLVSKQDEIDLLIQKIKKDCLHG